MQVIREVLAILFQVFLRRTDLFLLDATSLTWKRKIKKHIEKLIRKIN